MKHTKSHKHLYYYFIIMNHQYICHCNNCDWIFIDKNPQANAPLFDTENIAVSKLPMANIDWAWSCPKCFTDDYLADYAPECHLCWRGIKIGVISNWLSICIACEKEFESNYVEHFIQ